MTKFYTFPAFSKKDLYNLSPSDLSEFYTAKESQYAERRARIARVCNIITSVYDSGRKSRMLEIKERNISYNPKDKVAYCAIPKVFIIIST